MGIQAQSPQAAPNPVIKRWITRQPLLAFFVIAFAFSWGIALPLLLLNNPPVMLIQILGAFAGPTVAAFLVTATLDGRPGMRRLLRRYIQWREGLGWYLLVLFGPILFLTLGALPFLGVSILDATLNNLSLLLTLYLPLVVVGVIFGPLWEEPGWRGFALPRLQKKHGPLIGTLILGLMWSLWHLPGYIGGWLGPQTFSTLMALVLGITAFAVIITWVNNNVHGSLLLVILLHSAFNAASSYGSKILPAELPAATRSLILSGWIPAFTYTVCALLITLITRGTLDYHPSNGQ
jgi:membrane protease YdiL (CAAX protease family)